MPSLDANELTIRIPNYDKLISSCESILETCHVLGMTEDQAEEWLSNYLTENIEIEV